MSSTQILALLNKANSSSSLTDEEWTLIEEGEKNSQEKEKILLLVDLISAARKAFETHKTLKRSINEAEIAHYNLEKSYSTFIQHINPSGVMKSKLHKTPSLGSIFGRAGLGLVNDVLPLSFYSFVYNLLSRVLSSASIQFILNKYAASFFYSSSHSQYYLKHAQKIEPTPNPPQTQASYPLTTPSPPCPQRITQPTNDPIHQLYHILFNLITLGLTPMTPTARRLATAGTLSDVGVEGMYEDPYLMDGIGEKVEVDVAY